MGHLALVFAQFARRAEVIGVEPALRGSEFTRPQERVESRGMRSHLALTAVA